MNTEWKRDRAVLLAHLGVTDVEAKVWSDKKWAQFIKELISDQRRKLKQQIVDEVIKSLPMTIEGIANVQVDRSGPQSAYIRVQPKPDGDPDAWGAQRCVHCYSVKITEMKQDPMAGHPVPDLAWYSESTWLQAGDPDMFGDGVTYRIFGPVGKNTKLGISPTNPGGYELWVWSGPNEGVGPGYMGADLREQKRAKRLGWYPLLREAKEAAAEAFNGTSVRYRPSDDHSHARNQES
jgi:hypothetical protein